jgi:hypothetical protein
MDSISDILAAAIRLGPSELSDLKKAIERLESEARAVTLQVGEQTCSLVPLDVTEFYSLLRQSIAIEDDHGFQLRFYFLMRDSGNRLNFAEVYTALRQLAGESRRSFDDWKGAFSFPFTLSFSRHGQEVTYLFEVNISRDSLYFPLRKVVAKDDERLKTHYYYQPIPEEFSQDEINRFMVFFYGFMKGTLRSLDRASIPPFVRSVPASRIIFGFHTGAYFEEQYKSEDEYLAGLNRHRQQVENESPTSVAPNVIL